MNFKDFEENIRHEIVINQVRQHEIGGQIKVSDGEVEHAMDTQAGVTQDKSQYHLGHILIAIPEAASSDVIQKAKQKADEVVAKLRASADFNKIAVEMSDGARSIARRGFRLAHPCPDANYFCRIASRNRCMVTLAIRYEAPAVFM